MRWLFVVLLGCGSGIALAPIANHASGAAHPPECTDALLDKLGDKLRARWQTTPLELRCTAGHFGVDGYFLEARNADIHRIGVVDASGAELVAFVDEPEPDAGIYLNGYQAADLDGDGEDEIVESWRRTADNWLVVRRIADGHFTSRIHGPFVSRYHPDLGGCSATWEVKRNALVVAVHVEPGIPPTDCLASGRHQFALRGELLVERAR